MTLLILDDDITILTALEMALKDEFKVFKASQPFLLQSILDSQNIDIIISDFDFGAETILKYIPKISTNAQFIIMTGKASRTDIINLISFKIMNFIEKPISIQELRTKILAIAESDTNIAKISQKLDIQIDHEQKAVNYNNQKIKLTPSEYKILTYLLKNTNKTIKRSIIEKKLWNEVSVSKNTLDTHIYNLKKKLPLLSPKLLSVYGDGFLLKL